MEYEKKESISNALSQFEDYIDDIESSLKENPNKSIEISKGLIDSICKTVLRDLGFEYNNNWNSQKLLRETLNKLPFLKSLQTKDSESVKKIINGITTLSQGICELRNNNSFITHGKDIREETCEQICAKLVFDAVKTTGNFILEIHTNLTSLLDKRRILYEDYQDFNDWYDKVNGEVTVGKLKFSASQTLFNNDVEAYKEALNEFREIKETD